jgi:hypothetical protein
MATKHSHGPNFGRREAGCPRCEELAAGAPPVEWAWTKRKPDVYVPCDHTRCGFDPRSHTGFCTANDW